MSKSNNEQLDLIQMKGKHGIEIENSDILSSLEFSQDGDLLAIGDRGGRIVILRHNLRKKSNLDEYYVYGTFQSHELDFDYLKSVEIEEKINKIAWLLPSYDCRYLMTTNDKTPKLFVIQDRIKAKHYSSRLSSVHSEILYAPDEHSQFNQGCVSRQTSFGSYSTRETKSRRVYGNAHHYNINSIGICANQEYFLSSDDLRINLWSLDRNDTCFTIVDIKPESMEMLSEIITQTVYHPHNQDIFLYATSKGCVKLCDTRLSAICDTPTMIFMDDDSKLKSSRYADALFSIGSVDFNSDSRYFVTRNYLELKIWDCNMNKGPVESILVQDFLNTEDTLGDLYDQDLIFDKFEVTVGNNDNFIATGSYDDLFIVHKRDESHKWEQHYYLAQPENVRYRLIGHQLYDPVIISNDKSSKKHKTIRHSDIQLKNKVTTLSCHPTQHLLAVAIRQNLLLFNTNPSLS